MTTTIKIEKKTRKKIALVGSKGESYNDIIERLLDYSLKYFEILNNQNKKIMGEEISS